MHVRFQTGGCVFKIFFTGDVIAIKHRSFLCPLIFIATGQAIFKHSLADFYESSVIKKLENYFGGKFVKKTKGLISEKRVRKMKGLSMIKAYFDAGRIKCSVAFTGVSSAQRFYTKEAIETLKQFIATKVPVKNKKNGHIVTYQYKK